MIGVTGNNLNVLIIAKYNLQSSWQAFVAYHSIKQNLPDAKIAFVCARDFSNISYFKWVKTIDTKFFQHENVGKKINCENFNRLYGLAVALREQISGQPVLVIDSDLIAVRPLLANIDVLSTLNQSNFAYSSDHSVWYFNLPIAKLESTLMEWKNFPQRNILNFIEGTEVPELCGNIESNENFVFVHSPKLACDNDYIPFKEDCFPAEPSINESVIIKLWKTISILYLTTQ